MLVTVVHRWTQFLCVYLAVPTIRITNWTTSRCVRVPPCVIHTSFLSLVLCPPFFSIWLKCVAVFCYIICWFWIGCSGVLVLCVCTRIHQYTLNLTAERDCYHNNKIMFCHTLSRSSPYRSSLLHHGKIQKATSYNTKHHLLPVQQDGRTDGQCDNKTTIRKKLKKQRKN